MPGMTAPAGRVAARSGKKKRAEEKRTSSDLSCVPPTVGCDEFEGIPTAAILHTDDFNNEGSDTFHSEFYAQSKPCVISGAASDWPAAQEWNFAGVQSLLNEHGQAKEMLDIVVYNDGHYEVQRLSDLDDFLDLLYQGCVSSGPQGRYSKGGPNKAIYSATLRRHGVDVPRKAVADSCPVPQILRQLHEAKSIRLRELSGRSTVKVAPAAKGPFGLCQPNPMGHAGFFVQVKGSATYLIYGPDALPLKRDRSFLDSVPEDFNSPKVRAKYEGTVARLNEGDMLFLPPFSYFTARPESPWNVTVDFLCLPDEVWASAGNSAAALNEAASLLGGRSLLCYTLPAALPDEHLIKQIQEGLLAATFGGDSSMVVRVMVARGGKVAEGLRAAPLCASATSLSELLLECAITSEAVFASPRDCLLGLALLAYQQIVKGEGAKHELEMNIGSLLTAAWTTLVSGHPLAPRPEFRESPEGAYSDMVPDVMETASQLWKGKAKSGKRSSPTSKPSSVDSQVEKIVSAMASALDDLLIAVQAGMSKKERTGTSCLSREEVMKLRTSDGRPLDTSALEPPVEYPGVPSLNVTLRQSEKPASPGKRSASPDTGGADSMTKSALSTVELSSAPTGTWASFDLGFGTTTGMLMAGGALACMAAGGLVYLRMSSSSRS